MYKLVKKNEVLWAVALAIVTISYLLSLSMLRAEALEPTPSGRRPKSLLKA